MKGYKFALLIIGFILIASSCSPKTLKKPNVVEDVENEKINDDDLETEINNSSIKEDERLTEKTLKSPNIDYILTGKDQEEKSSKINMNLSNFIVNKSFNSKDKNNFDTDLMYKRYLMPEDYILITKDKIEIYMEPTTNANVVASAYIYEKLKVSKEVIGQYRKDGNSDKWYLVSWSNKDGYPFHGFIPASSGELRSFRFSEMHNQILTLEEAIATNKYGYVSNYKDVNGSPPLINNKAMDQYGTQAYQSAPAYRNLEDKSQFRYVPDGMMVFIKDEIKGYYKVKIIDYEGQYWIPKKYISLDNNLDTLSKVVVVDIKNQNQGVFENRGDNWTLVSYGLATTGVEGKASYVTPIGKFKVLDKKERFYYLGEGSDEIAGYAPYGVRFAQGAYIHGIPVEYIKENGENIDPGMREFLFTIGTFPRSHKCVRNYTSHAKFLFDWLDVNDSAVIVFK